METIQTAVPENAILPESWSGRLIIAYGYYAL